MTLLAAILTLSAAAPPAAAPAAVDGLEAMEDVLLPAAHGRLGLQVRALEALIVIETPSRSTPQLVRAIRRSPRSLCAGVDEAPFQVRLHCRSKRIVARLAAREGGYLLRIGETRGLPWDGEDGPPLVAFDPPSVEMGKACPGSTPAGRAECHLARGERASARAALEEVTDGPALDLAELRRGDLAFADGDARAATRAWGRVRAQPWHRLASARLCEAAWACVSSARAESLFAWQGLPEPLARDMSLRRARVLAFLGRAPEAARALLPTTDGGACSSAPSLCRRLALVALRAPGPDAVDGLLLWLDLPERDRGAAGYELELAAADVAERSGAPLFAANILAAAAGHTPAAALDAHLLRTSELYLIGGDRVRAGVVLEFARARAGKGGLRGARWAAVARAASTRTPRPAPPAAAPDRALLQRAEDADLLAAAGRSAQAARAVLGGGRP